ncbi:MAG: sulfatase-like hydrolase/transferase, partial [Phycisphaerae bacterium]|nr:sulfatase-like hydrolase/transferase [Phycisphaerae bacterium]
GKAPFMLTLFYYSAHDPFQGRKDLIEKIEAEHPNCKGWKSAFAAMIAAIDESVGRIRAAIKKKALDENTVILFVGDQGGKVPNGPLRGTKRGGRALYEGGARIPLQVCWPGVAKPGSTRSHPVCTNDIFPTMLAMAGGKPADYPKLDGESLVGMLKGAESIDRKEVVIYRSYEDQYAAVRSGKWKLVAYRSGKCELYDLVADIGEQKDLSADQGDKVKELTSVLRAFEKKMNVPGKIDKRK